MVSYTFAKKSAAYLTDLPPPLGPLAWADILETSCGERELRYRHCVDKHGVPRANDINSTPGFWLSGLRPSPG